MALPDIFDDIRLPLVAAPMFLVSGVELTLEACRAGICGTFPALNQRTTEGFEAWVVEIKAALAEFRQENPHAPVGPFGVNLIVHRSNPRLQADLEVCVSQEVPLVITSLGAVEEVVDAVHSYGGVVFHDVTKRRHAQKAIDAGVDGIVLVAGGAGGHAGTTNPFALLHDIRSIFDGTILLAGALSTGRDVAAARAMGADLAYMGTRFIATKESRGQDEYKQMLCDARPEDIVYTPAVSGVPASFMRQSLEQNGFDMDKLTDSAHVDFGEKLTAGDEAKAWKTVWSAGHGVCAIDDVPSVAELVARIDGEYREAIEELAKELQ
jgi:nitronate monooxygenase